MATCVQGQQLTTSNVKEATMIRVLVEHQTNQENVERVIDLIRELRNEAMRQPGYITGETLVNTADISNIMVISTWRSLKDWQAWDTCDTRRKITSNINPLLTQPYTIHAFRYYLTKENRVWSTF